VNAFARSGTSPSGLSACDRCKPFDFSRLALSLEFRSFSDLPVRGIAFRGSSTMDVPSMSAANPSETIMRTLLAEAVARVVADAAAEDEILRVGPLACRLFATYPGANRSIGHITDLLILAAANAGVVVEISRAPSGP
jgi:hypothetical protein